MHRGDPRTPQAAQTGDDELGLQLVDAVFDGPPAPAPHSPRLIEVEDQDGRSVVAGTWRPRSDGTWAMTMQARLPEQQDTPSDLADRADRADRTAGATGIDELADLSPRVPKFAPMLATTGREVPRAMAGYAFEFKFDGVRTLARADAGRVQLVSRAGNDVSSAYPELAVLGELLAEHTVALDGEIVALDHGVPSFRRLQRRMHVRTPTPLLVRSVPVAYYVFDLLYLDGQTVINQSYSRRRQLLTELAEQAGLNAGQLVQVPASYADVDGQVLLDVARDNNLEGIVAKRADAPYQPGIRSPDWLKFPLVRTTEAVVCGWRPGTGRRAGGIGSLLLGAHDHQHQLVYIGHVGTGFTQQALTELYEQLTPLRQSQSPFSVPVPREHVRDARWIRPVLVGEVAYKDFGGDRLRLPVWRGLRPDRAPSDVGTPGY